MQPKSELSSRKPKEMQGNLLGFPFISLAESGLCSGLQAKKIKKSHLAQLASRVVFETVSGRGSAVNGSIPAEPRARSTGANVIPQNSLFANQMSLIFCCAD
jgi:hypothetical protein